MKADEPTGGVLYEEKQSFPRWLLILVLSPLVITIVVTIALSSHQDRNEVLLALGIILPVEVLMFFIFYRVRLEKTVTRDGLYYRWYPVQKKYRMIPKKEIDSIKLRRPPFLNYGYGFYPGYGRYHNMNQGEGMQVYLKSGRKIYFGTEDVISFEKSLQELLSSKTQDR
jgi:hypothetical protein